MMYKKVYHSVKKDITDGKYTEGQKLPSENEIAEEFKTTRMTVRRSLQMLVDDGYVVNIPKSGYYINNQVLMSEFRHLKLSSLHQVYPGAEIKNEIIKFEYISCPSDVAKKLNVEDETPVIHGIRKRYVNGKCMQFETVYMPIDIFKRFKREHYQKSVYNYVEKFHTINFSLKTLSAGLLPEEYAEYVEEFVGKPLLISENISTFDNGVIFEYSKNYHLDQMFKIISYRQKSI